MRKALPITIILLILIFAESGIAYWTNHKTRTKTIHTSAPEQKNEEKKIISSIILSGASAREEGTSLLNKVADQITPPKTIILITSTVDGSSIQTSDKTFSTSDREVETNKEVIQSLLTQKVENKPATFSSQDVFQSMVSQVTSTWPKATLVPLLIPPKVDYQAMVNVHDSLNSTCRNCLLIAATDISRDLPSILANLHDVQTERALKNRDSEMLFQETEADSPSTLALLTLWAKSHDHAKFRLEKRVNSAELANKPDDKTTTSMLGWYETGEANKPEENVTFLIGGDMMFGRNVAHHFLFLGKDFTKSFEKLGDRVFWGLDAGIANLEGPVSDVPVSDDIRPNNFTFNFPPETISVLKYLRLDAVSLANNHTHNKGNKGLATTRRLLDEAGIKWIGGPVDEDVTKTECFPGEKFRLCVIGVHLLATQPDLSETIKALKAEPDTRVMIFPHWGAEYQAVHGTSSGKLAHAWIDAGADIVIGAHPHWIQDAEVYKGKPIFYSLGNLLFDQDFSDKTQQGLLIGGKFTDDKLEVFALPVQSTKHQPALAHQPAKGNILGTLYKPLIEYKQSTPAGDIYLFPLK